MAKSTATPEKIDLFKLHRAEYAQPKSPKVIDVGPAKYIVVDGHGEPGGAMFESRIGALYGMAYTLKFNSKFAGQDYTVGKLEGLYSVDGAGVDGSAKPDPKQMKWRLMIRVPDFISKKHLANARQTLQEKGKEGDFDAVGLETVKEGTCVQMLHVGPYDREQQTIEAMHEFAGAEGLAPHMWHHEIYLSDPRRVTPEKLKTIIRLPVKKK